MKHFLILNSGSSSLKFSIFEFEHTLRAICSGNLSGIAPGAAGNFKVRGEGITSIDESVPLDSHSQAIARLLVWLKNNLEQPIDCIGHRVVHGGRHFTEPKIIDDSMLATLHDVARFAPLHLPSAIMTIKAARAALGDIPHVACFDTSFHRTMPTRARMLPLNRELFFEDGVEKFGFHGISYEYVLGQLKEQFGEDVAVGKVVIAHLGNGCSMAAIENGKSVETTMGFSPTGGLVMGTRSGDLDPGLLTYFATERLFSAAEFVDFCNQESGLYGLSGVSSDMKTLLDLEDENEHARRALEIYCYHAQKHIGALAAAMNGLDALVFTGGIGENAAPIRQRICKRLGFLGIQIDENLNEQGAGDVSQQGAKSRTFVIRTNEELMIAKHCLKLIS